MSVHKTAMMLQVHKATVMLPQGAGRWRRVRQRIVIVYPMTAFAFGSKSINIFAFGSTLNQAATSLFLNAMWGGGREGGGGRTETRVTGAAAINFKFEKRISAKLARDF